MWGGLAPDRPCRIQYLPRLGAEHKVRAAPSTKCELRRTKLAPLALVKILCGVCVGREVSGECVWGRGLVVSEHMSQMHL